MSKPEKFDAVDAGYIFKALMALMAETVAKTKVNDDIPYPLAEAGELEEVGAMFTAAQAAATEMTKQIDPEFYETFDGVFAYEVNWGDLAARLVADKAKNVAAVVTAWLTAEGITNLGEKKARHEVYKRAHRAAGGVH